MSKSYNNKIPSWYMDKETQVSLKKEAREQRNKIRQLRRMRENDPSYRPLKRDPNPLMW